MNKKKKILLICNEVFSYPMFFLGKELERQNNYVHYYFINKSDVINKNSFNKTTYFYFKDKIEDENIHDLKKICFEFIKNKKDIKVDQTRLKELEEKYTYFKGLNKQILSSQPNSTPYHDRFYYRPTSFKENLYWLILNYNNTEEILNLTKPDCIFDLETSQLQRTIINEVANFKKIKYVQFEDTRYKNFKIPTFNLGHESEKYFVEAYNRNKTNKNLQKYIEEVQDYVMQSQITPKRYLENKEWHKNFSNKYKLSDALKHVINKTIKQMKFYLYEIRMNKNHIKYYHISSSNPIKRILWNYVFAIRKYYLSSNFNKYFMEPCEEKYIYLPLHVIPEGSTYIKGTMYLNQLSLVEAISKLLPITWKLYVKEHPNMIGQRNIDFYKKISRFHNVKLVKLNAYKDAKSWIEKSQGVVTITGTTAFEAAMLNKPAIVLGNNCYNILPNVRYAKSLNELEPLIKLIKNNNFSKDDEIGRAVYLKTIQELGEDLDLSELVRLSSKKISAEVNGSANLETLENDELKNIIKKLISFYEKAENI